jgi:hypothetical protein
MFLSAHQARGKTLEDTHTHSRPHAWIQPRLPYHKPTHITETGRSAHSFFVLISRDGFECHLPSILSPVLAIQPAGTSKQASPLLLLKKSTCSEPSAVI